MGKTLILIYFYALLLLRVLSLQFQVGNVTVYHINVTNKSFRLNIPRDFSMFTLKSCNKYVFFARVSERLETNLHST